MKSRKQKIKEVNDIKSFPFKILLILRVGNGHFNNTLHVTAGSTPFQPVTQITYTICDENVTKRNKSVLLTTRRSCELQGQGVLANMESHMIV